MKNTFYRPEEINTEEFTNIISKMNQDLMDISKGYVGEKELKEYLEKLISNQKDLPRNPEMGFWGLALAEEMPSDARVRYFYMPTYIATGILMNCKLNHYHITKEIPGFNDALRKALLASTGRSFQGSGHDHIEGMIKTVNIFITAKAHIFIEKFPNDCKEFTKVFKEIIQMFEQAILSGKTKGDWGEDYSIQYQCILQAVDPKKYLNMDKIQKNKEVYLFVYGTLMRNNRKGQTYLEDAKFTGECTLKGYALYDLGHFPGIVEEEGRVKGELYAISMDCLPEIDRYEGEGALYKRKIVQVYNENNEVLSAYAYVYNQSTAGRVKVDYEYQPWVEGIVDKIKKGNHVWYACYGSNMNKDRFMRYINRCSDKTPPKDEKPYILNHPIYFAKQSPSWEHQGVAFLDLQKPGKTYGKMYLITSEQLAEIQQQEGPGWYNKIEKLGSEDGIPVNTLTHASRYIEDVIPCKAYLEIVRKGIRETYSQLSDENIDVYLMERCLGIEMINVLRYLRDQEHGTKLNKICMDISNDKSRIINAIQGLRILELIKQDGRSIRAGAEWNSDDAVYYTMSDKRTAIDRLVG